MPFLPVTAWWRGSAADLQLQVETFPGYGACQVVMACLGHLVAALPLSAVQELLW